MIALPRSGSITEVAIDPRRFRRVKQKALAHSIRYRLILLQPWCTLLSLKNFHFLPLFLDYNPKHWKKKLILRKPENTKPPPTTHHTPPTAHLPTPNIHHLPPTTSMILRVLVDSPLSFRSGAVLAEPGRAECFSYSCLQSKGCDLFLQRILHFVYLIIINPLFLLPILFTIPPWYPRSCSIFFLFFFLSAFLPSPPWFLFVAMLRFGRDFLISILCIFQIMALRHGDSFFIAKYLLH